MTAQTPVPPAYGRGPAARPPGSPGRARELRTTNQRLFTCSSPIPQPTAGRWSGELGSRPGAAPCCPGPGTSSACGLPGRRCSTRRWSGWSHSSSTPCTASRVRCRATSACSPTAASSSRTAPRRTSASSTPSVRSQTRSRAWPSGSAIRRRRPGACPRACSSPSCLRVLLRSAVRPGARRLRLAGRRPARAGGVPDLRAVHRARVERPPGEDGDGPLPARPP